MGQSSGDRRELVCELIAQLKWGEWKTVEELQDACDMREWSMRKWLTALVQSGIVTQRRRKTGEKSAPYEFIINAKPFEIVK